MTSNEGRAFIPHLSFPPQIEAEFQENYYSRMRPMPRIALFLIAALSAFSALLHIQSGGFLVGSSLSHLGVAVFNLLLLGFSFSQRFVRVWQPLLVASLIASFAAFYFSTNNRSGGFVVLYVLLVAWRIQRLQLFWMAVQLMGMLAIAACATIPRLITMSAQEAWTSAVGMLLLSLLMMAGPLSLTLKSEQFERSEFWTKYLLAEERNDERHKREQTEKMLHVLSQAIGGIVHDLGNPLTAVQSGAETLLLFVKEGEPDKEVVQEFAEIITDGAQMLNYLRLSLMEQTRVLEGKPVPVELKPASIHHLVKAGAHYQKPKLTGGRKVSFEGEDLHVCVDEMRFITILMNLIGNALKYSDGEVRISWRTHEDQVLIAVLDQGQKSQGISQAQAQQLFVAFGRLDTHTEIEGTGLGLLSVRKIAEAHGGEVYIEGIDESIGDGTESSATFSTARGTYPSMLEKGFRTAFVTACPLEMVPHPNVPQLEVEKLPMLHDAVRASHT
jgi:signal transduction histidine kinase